MLCGFPAEKYPDAQFLFHSSCFRERTEDRGWKIEDRRGRIDLRSSILYPRLICVRLRLLSRRRRLLLDYFHDLAGVALLVELQDEVFGLDRIAFVVEGDGAGDAFEVLDVAHRRRDLRPTRFFAAAALQRLLHRFDADQRGVVA